MVTINILHFVEETCSHTPFSYHYNFKKNRDQNVKKINKKYGSKKDIAIYSWIGPLHYSKTFVIPIF